MLTSMHCSILKMTTLSLSILFLLLLKTFYSYGFDQYSVRINTANSHKNSRLYSSRTLVPSPTIKIPKKYILVTGGVISGIGKGITASSIGVLIKMLNLKPTAIKIDPYLNVDAGTMSPFEHGETFVLDDGAETDLDLGNYERFLDVRLTNDSNLTTGKIYREVIARERKGEYLGKTVQIIPHITNEIMQRILAVSRQSVDAQYNNVKTEPDICVIELGGTIGDIESMPFVEALRQLQLLVRPENFCIVHVSMVPVTGSEQEQKTKPTQHSIKELRGLGLTPDFIACRSKYPLTAASREKISLFCNVPPSHVLSVYDVNNIYEVPLMMLDQGLHAHLSKRLKLDEVVFQKQKLTPPREVITFASKVVEEGTSCISYPWNEAFAREWTEVARKMETTERVVKIAIVGKYTNQQDAYLSVISSIKHSCIATSQRLELIMIESSNLEDTVRLRDVESYETAWRSLRSADGIIVPGGFGIRGIEGKVNTIKYARENKVPFLGICLGMQVAVIEYARNKLGLAAATSREFDANVDDANAAVIFMPEGSKETMGGTMRLGARSTLLKASTKAQGLYDGASIISERHRHRYEVNPDLVEGLEKAGLIFSGRDETGRRMEIVELPSDVHPYFVAVQFHPEFKSRPQRPAPVFLGLLESIKSLKEAEEVKI